MDLPEHIRDEECLYRAVRALPNLWKDKQNRPSSVVFDNPDGVSVDRDGLRQETEIVDRLRETIDPVVGLRAVIRITAGECREIGTHPVADPREDNAFHAEIHGSDRTIWIPEKAKRRELAKRAQIVSCSEPAIDPEEDV